MPIDVGNAFVELFCEHGGLSKDEADRLLKKLIQCRRYQTEAWS